MHKTQFETIDSLIQAYIPQDKGTVYDIGSYDVNGTHKPSVVQRGFSYVGVDVVEGPNVDLVVDPYHWPMPDDSCDHVISGSCLEHVEAPWLWVKELERCLKPGGTCIVLLPFIFPEHKFPVDYYRILPDGLRFLFTQWAKLECLNCGFSGECLDHPFTGGGGPAPYYENSFIVGRKRGGERPLTGITTHIQYHD